MGGKGVLVPSGHRPGPTEPAGETGVPLEILLYIKNEIPLPRLRGYRFLLSMGAGGGERAPVALCREPTEAAAETRGWVSQNYLTQQARR